MQEKPATDTTFATPSDQPDPAAKTLDEPRLSGDDLQREIGDSEAWDEASEDAEDAAPAGDD